MESGSNKGGLDLFHKILNLIIIFYGLFIVFDGLYYVSITSEEVVGSDFGMLITIVHMFALIFILAGIKAVDLGIMAFAKRNGKTEESERQKNS